MKLPTQLYDPWRKQSLWKAEGYLREALSLLINAKIDPKTQEMLEQILRQVEIERS